MKKTYSITEPDILDLVNTHAEFKTVSQITVQVDKSNTKTADMRISWIDYGHIIGYKITLYEESMWALDYWTPLLELLQERKKVYLEDVLKWLKLLGYEEVK